jgi:hypothetical protein
LLERQLRRGLRPTLLLVFRVLNATLDDDYDINIISIMLAIS